MEILLHRIGELMPHITILFPYQRITVDYSDVGEKKERILIEGFVNDISKIVSDMQNKEESYPTRKLCNWITKVFHFKCGEIKMHKTLNSIIIDKYRIVNNKR